MKRFAFSALFFFAAALAQAGARFDSVTAPGLIQIAIVSDQSIEPTTVTAVAFDGATTHTKKVRVDDANSVVSIETKDSPTTYTVELKVDRATIFGPSKIKTANIEDYKFGRPGGAIIRSLLRETSGTCTYDSETLSALTPAEHDAFEKRFRVLIRRLYMRDAKLAADRAAAAAKALQDRVAE